MPVKRAFENKRDNVSGVVRCPQCQTAFKSLKDCEVIDGFVYCPICDYLIIRGD